jgi:hypothetical protein
MRGAGDVDYLLGGQVETVDGDGGISHVQIQDRNSK